jgi:hypothetical protein
MTPHPQGNGKPGDVPQSEREKFEAWAKDRGWDVTPGGRNYFRNHDTDYLFIGWQARAGQPFAATPQPAIPPGFKVVRKCPHNWQNWVNHHNGTNAPWCPQCCIDPLSAAPVPEAWQGVSDEQIDAIAEAQDDEGWFVGQLTKLEWRAFARAVLSAANLSPAPPQSAQLMEPK